MTRAPLAGRVALVTGAGRPGGIGRVTARKLASMGADVALTDLGRRRPELDVADYTAVAQSDAIEDGAAELRMLGVRSVAVPADLSSDGEVAMVVERVVSELERIDILFNNAGTAVGVGPFLDTTPGDWDLAWQINVMGVVRSCRSTIPIMLGQGGGVIINNSSIGGLLGEAGFGPYNPTKWALVGLTRCLAREFGPHGIRVNAIAPGTIETAMGAASGSVVARAAGRDESEGERMILDSTPLERLGRPEEVAEVVAFLASDAASYVHGAVLPVDGGVIS